MDKERAMGARTGTTASQQQLKEGVAEVARSRKRGKETPSTLPVPGTHPGCWLLARAVQTGDETEQSTPSPAQNQRDAQRAGALSCTSSCRKCKKGKLSINHS